MATSSMMMNPNMGGRRRGSEIPKKRSTNNTNTVCSSSKILISPQQQQNNVSSSSSSRKQQRATSTPTMLILLFLSCFVLYRTTSSSINNNIYTTNTTPRITTTTTTTFNSQQQQQQQQQERTTTTIPSPIQVMEQYIKWHSVDKLLEEEEEEEEDIEDGKYHHHHHRKYAIGFYSCPLQAGNRLHHYLNGLLWAIITNRTIMWKYWDTNTCLQYGKDYNPKICKSMNNVTDCDEILQRNAWIPSYDVWYEKLQNGIVSDDKDEILEPYELPYFTTHYPNVSLHNRRYEWGKDGNNASVFGVDNITKYPQQIVIFPQERFKDTLLYDGNGNDGIVNGSKDDTNTIRQTMLHTEWSRQTAAKLYELGPNFLYGMLHKYSFSFSDNVMKAATAAATASNGTSSSTTLQQLDNNQQNNIEEDGKNYYNIALHSRHRYPELDGCNIDREASCLRRVLQGYQQQQQQQNYTNEQQNHTNEQQQQQQQRQCIVSIMSDRECTITSLKTWLRKHHDECTVRVSSHEVGGSFFEEHGPYAGMGYFQDLALVSQATSSFIGMGRSSSDLLLELIEFNRIMGKLNRGGEDIIMINNTTEQLDKCLLPFVGPSSSTSTKKRRRLMSKITH